MAGVTVMWRAARSLGRSPAANSVPDSSRYEVTRKGNVTDHRADLGVMRAHVAAPVRIFSA
jgi:hypothetical protein